METMPTVVQSFLVEETKELVLDGDKLAEWAELVAELNFAGQLDTATGDKSPIPFVHIKPNLMNVIEQLCPRSIEAGEYNVTPIPIDVLKLIKLSVNEKYFNSIKIYWDDKTPDPFVVGMTGYWGEMQWYDNSNKELKGLQFDSERQLRDAGGIRPTFYIKEKYLIAKWGDVAMSLEELSKKAKERFMEFTGAELRKKIKEAQNALSTIEEDAIEKFTL